MDDLISRQAAIDEVSKYASIWMEYDGGMTQEEVAEAALKAAKRTMVHILEELPSAQPSFSQAHENDHIAEVSKKDCISRQAAIDIERNATVDTNPSHFEAHQKFTQFMDDAEISSFGRWQWSNGFNTALTAVGIDLKKLPSAQPEQRWIPCSERLPKESGQYYVSGGGKAWICEYLIIPNFTIGGWCNDALNPVVRAWMPLPKPYRGGTGWE